MEEKRVGKRHILITGSRKSGKTLMTDSIIREIRRHGMEVYGFQTQIMVHHENGYHGIFMYPAGQVDKDHMAEDNHVGDCNTRERTINLKVFDGLGTDLIRGAKPDGILVMDELGFMEADAESFTKAVLDALDGDIPVFATVKKVKMQVDFLDKVLGHPGAEVYELTEDNYDQIYGEVLPEVLGWCTQE